MAIHLVECAARVALRPVEKLALLCFADSADRVTRIAFPGLAEIQTWTGTGRSQSLNVVARLVELQLLERRKRGHRGQRAEFVVFPLGCCEQHGKQPAEAENDDIGEALGPDGEISTGSGSEDPYPDLGSEVAQERVRSDTGKGSDFLTERVRRLPDPSLKASPSTYSEQTLSGNSPQRDHSPSASARGPTCIRFLGCRQQPRTEMAA